MLWCYIPIYNNILCGIFTISTFSPKKDVKVILITQRRVGYYLRDHIIKCFCVMPYTYIVYLNEIDINQGDIVSNLTLTKEILQKTSYFCYWIVYANWTWFSFTFLFVEVLSEILYKSISYLKIAAGRYSTNIQHFRLRIGTI